MNICCPAISHGGPATWWANVESTLRPAETARPVSNGRPGGSLVQVYVYIYIYIHIYIYIYNVHIYIYNMCI